MYQCIYCKAAYDHDRSYQHNAYECPKQRKRMKQTMVSLLLVCAIGLQGCDLIKEVLPKEDYPDNVDRAELTLYVGGKVYKYACQVNPATKSLADCQEVQ